MKDGSTSDQERRLDWYLSLDQRLAHRLRYDERGLWREETLCGLPFWPWFRAKDTERRCAKCRHRS